MRALGSNAGSRALAACAFTIAPIACNAILGNDPASLADASVDASLDAAEDRSAPDAVSVDAATPDHSAPPDAAAEAQVDATARCAAGTKECFGACVATTDPLYGCASPGCAPCALAHATSVCAGGSCAISSCAIGFADCDQTNATGCETDLSQASHCGACNAVCPTTAPVCIPQGSTFACATGCGSQAPTLCGTQCVDTQTSATHCGGCNTSCPAPTGGSASCVAGRCGEVCPNGTHVCGGACANNASIASCGTSCTTCPSGPNATPTCNGVACGLSCAPGWSDCDAIATNGCEAQLASDNRNCGACNHACAAGQSCVGGSCVSPADAGADSDG